MLRKIRIGLAMVFFVAITFLFLDISGVAHRYLGWMAKVQFLPALMALNVAVVLGLLVLTLVFGRVYCSVVCPLGVMQDIFANIGRRRCCAGPWLSVVSLRFLLALAVWSPWSLPTVRMVASPRICSSLCTLAAIIFLRALRSTMTAMLSTRSMCGYVLV